MRRPITQLLVAGLLLCGALFVPMKKALYHRFENGREEMEAREGKENEEGKEGEEEERESGMAGSLSAWFWSRAYPDPYYLNEKYMKGWEEAQELRNRQNTRGNREQSGSWVSCGPNSGIGGRILSIAIDPTNSSKLWAGSAGGGIWKCTNGTAATPSWTAVTTGLPLVSATSIIIDPGNANAIYAGTGEIYRSDSTGATPLPQTTGFNVWKTRGTYGIGIIKSCDGGVTWRQVMVKNTSNLFGVQMLKFDAVKKDTVYACATDGLYRSLDSGHTWNPVWKVTYVSDVEASGNNIVAAVGNFGNVYKGIYKSTDFGVTWVKATGLPASSTIRGFTRLSCVSTDPNTIVASVGVNESSSGAQCPTNCPTELYRSTDFGSTFTGLTGSGHTNWQYWCAHDVAINPSTTTSILYGGVKWHKYTLPSTAASLTTGHDDLHDIQFDPSNASNVYICCDGGVYRSTNGGSTFSAINTGLGATQFYPTLGVSATDPNFFVGGLQDNGEWYYNGTTWTAVPGVGGDGTSCGIDPSNDANMVVCRDARGTYKSINKGSGSTIAGYWGNIHDQRTAFAAPMVYSKSQPDTIYLGTDELYTSYGLAGFVNAAGSAGPGTNYIDGLNKTAIALGVSPTNGKKVYASVSNMAQNDGDLDNIIVNGTPNVLKTTTGNVPFTSIMGSVGNQLPNRYIMDFAISKTYDDSVFVAVAGFGTNHVYVTGNGGSTWAPRGSGLPDVPFYAVLIDAVNPKVIYAAGDAGVWVSADRGATWNDFNGGAFWDGMQVTDLQVAADNTIVAATHGKGVFRSARFVAAPLPVTIISFTGEALSNGNRLNWAVGQESNVLHYEVERSIDGLHFTTVGIVRANNASSYSYLDAPGGNQSYYYRLKTVDNNGSYRYSEIIYLRRTATTSFQVLGNPFSSTLNVQLVLSQAVRTQFRLYDAAGKLLRAEEAVLPSGQNLYTLTNLDRFPAATYYLEVVAGEQHWKQKLLKK